MDNRLSVFFWILDPKSFLTIVYYTRRLRVKMCEPVGFSICTIHLLVSSCLYFLLNWSHHLNHGSPFCYFYLVSKSSRISRERNSTNCLPHSVFLLQQMSSNKNKSVLNYNWSLIFLNISCVLVFRWHSGLKNQENVSWTHF